MRTQNLTIIGGRLGAGKTVALLQWTRRMALDGETVVLACYEHDERTLIDRLLLMEVAQELKDLAMREDIVVVAAAIADRKGLDVPRLRLKHLDGSSTLTDESDAVLMLDDKYDVVHRTHIVDDSEKARDHRRWVVWSVEKHRDGAEGADLQFRKDFAHYRFEPTGSPISEKLIDERVEG